MKNIQLKYRFLIFILVVLSNHAFSQDFHQRTAKSVEEIIYQKDPNRARAIFNKGYYLVLENLRTNSRTRFYEGDVFRFKTKDDFVFENDIYAINDSSFVVTSLNEVTNRYEYVEIKLNEIERIYKRPKKPLRVNFTTFAPLGYLLFEWAYWGTQPLKSKKLPVAIILTAAQPLMGIISNQFRSKRITENYRIRIFKSL
ncbi:hypothetical protein EMA8858_01485 [Emticicia aquatica]|jgi:hypothetical protein|uniref:Uncharacterized protein n=1 Tax=Emticicia aquatica TaxID=1681835 RepID=A0ABM9APF1_9BACT|nr:hypothetical protein [Emticicia aquatica]CAH0995364.1 hypothetical protein EMA8858_01485 [Emticicia aquatica]